MGHVLPTFGYTHSQMLWPNPEPDELSYENTYFFAL